MRRRSSLVLLALLMILAIVASTGYVSRRNQAARRIASGYRTT
jgi:hypothetical protein